MNGNKKRILLFGTANFQRIEKILNNISIDAEVTFIASRHMLGALNGTYPFLTAIQTTKDHINYQEISRNKLLPRIHYHEVWVPSSLPDNYEAFGQVYALLTEVDYDRMIWIGSTGKLQITNNSVKARLRERAYYIVSSTVFSASWLLEKWSAKLKGYRW